jgi:hypothetical protein
MSTLQKLAKSSEVIPHNSDPAKAPSDLPSNSYVIEGTSPMAVPRDLKEIIDSAPSLSSQVRVFLPPAAITASAAAEELRASLKHAGFTDVTGSIRALPSVEEGKELVTFLTKHVPEGLDIVDLFVLIDQGIGWSEGESPVNAELCRLARYRYNRGWTKADAIRKPIEDVIISAKLTAPKEVHGLQLN